LLLNDDDTIAKQAAWSLSGGGKAKPLPRPSWQVMSTLGPGRYRFAPDVSFVGNQNTGVAIVYRGRWEAAGGTSLGAPAWAGIWALLEQNTKRAGKILGPAPSLLYQIGNSTSYATAFDDVTTGSNGHYRAGVGWDAVTGWGTPNVSGLAAVLSTLAHAP
jgi:kumamolisin